ncbi:hypothetical protein [Alicyclobacillus contaminans]|uniref:hypothetical protein n=1 Tax=Alicyclobacillus contaminans TaxID=392016 RepID=UPI0012EB76FF|nr:hypothetical protein [Alicyclobacillus contaminans]
METVDLSVILGYCEEESTGIRKRGVRMRESGFSAAPTDTSRLRRHRWLFLAGLGVVLAIGAAFAALTLQALRYRADNRGEFATYIANHQLGQVDLSDDDAGLSQPFCVVHLARDVADSRMEQTLYDLMYQYHTLDDGTQLTVEYRNPSTGMTHILGDAVYDKPNHVLRLTINSAAGERVVTESVDWS